MGLARRLTLGQAVVVGARPVAIDPVRSGMRADPVGGHNRKTGEGMAQGFDRALQAVEGADRAEHVC
jgi:hypothetical protein